MTVAAFKSASVDHSVKGHARARRVATDVTIVLDKSEHVVKDPDITNDGWLVAQPKFRSRPQSWHTSKEDQLIHGLDVVDFLPFQALQASHVDLENPVHPGKRLKAFTERPSHEVANLRTQNVDKPAKGFAGRAQLKKDRTAKERKATTCAMNSCPST